MLLQMALCCSFSWLSSIPLYICTSLLFLIFYFLIYLLIYLAVSGLSCHMRRIFSCGMGTLSCNMWDLAPWPGIKPRPPVLEAWSLSHWTTREVPHIFFIHSSVDGHSGCSHVLAIVNNAMNTGVHVSFWIIVLSGYMPSSGIVGSFGNSILDRKSVV